MSQAVLTAVVVFFILSLEGAVAQTCNCGVIVTNQNAETYSLLPYVQFANGTARSLDVALTTCDGRPDCDAIKYDSTPHVSDLSVTYYRYQLLALATNPAPYFTTSVLVPTRTITESVFTFDRISPYPCPGGMVLDVWWYYFAATETIYDGQVIDRSYVRDDIELNYCPYRGGISGVQCCWAPFNGTVCPADAARRLSLRLQFTAR